MKATLKTFCIVLAISLLCLVSVACGKNGIDPDNNGDNNNREKEIAELWSHFSENDIEFHGQFEQETNVEFKNANGETITTTGFPGMVLIITDKNVPIKDIWDAVINNYGEVVSQSTDIGLFLARVEKGKEGAFISKLQNVKGVNSAYPLISIGNDSVYYIDNGDHAKDVATQFSSGIYPVLQDAKAYDWWSWEWKIDEHSILDKGLKKALQREDCDIINLSQSPHYDPDWNEKENGEKGSNPREQYHYNHDPNDKSMDLAYVSKMVNWYNHIGEIITKVESSSAPIIATAGNEFMHHFDIIINGLNSKTRELLNSRLFIVCAEQNGYKEYSNSLSSGRIPGVITVNIDGVKNHKGENSAGTSLAAPRLVSYIWQLVKESEKAGTPLSFQEAATLISNRWRESTESAITSVFMDSILSDYQTTYCQFRGTGSEVWTFEYWSKTSDYYDKDVSKKTHNDATAHYTRIGSRISSLYIYAFPLLLSDWSVSTTPPELSNEVVTDFNLNSYTNTELSFTIKTDREGIDGWDDYCTYDVIISGIDSSSPSISVNSTWLSTSEDNDSKCRSEWKYSYSLDCFSTNTRSISSMLSSDCNGAYHQLNANSVEQQKQRYEAYLKLDPFTE